MSESWSSLTIFAAVDRAMKKKGDIIGQKKLGSEFYISITTHEGILYGE